MPGYAVTDSAASMGKKKEIQQRQRGSHSISYIVAILTRLEAKGGR